MYIVMRTRVRSVLGLVDGILWYCPYNTLFRDYEDARNAVRRTKRYAKAQSYDWDENLGEMYIIRLDWP